MIATATCEIRELLKDNNTEFGKLESASLRLHKFVCLDKNDDSRKAKEIDAVCKLINKSVKKSSVSDWSLPKGVTKSGKTIVLKLEGRLALHLAGGVLENAGMSIHPHFNCPWMPGSGVKGVARHAAWCRWQESQSKEGAFNLAWVFGYPTGDKKLNEFLKDNDWKYDAWAGTISFLPAFPIKNDFKAMVDIATSHHPDYYSVPSATAYDSENPKPLPFPVIEAGSSFQFTIRPVRKNGLPEGTPSAEKLLDLAEEFLKEGMTLYGAGAKTAAGYGWFSEDKELSEKIANEQKEREEVAKKKKEEEQKAKAEADAIAKMSPLERKVNELSKLSDDDFKRKINEIEGADELVKKAIIICLQRDKKHIWDADKKAKPKKMKPYARAEKIRKTADELGEVLK